MKYIIFTFTMGGVAGGPSFTSTKLKWLKQKGWDVVVFDHYGGLDAKDDVILPSLQPFRSNRMMDLFFPPSYYTKAQRRRILEKLIGKIGKANDYVIESHNVRLSLWGELLAEKIKAKHIILDINENVDIRTQAEYDYTLFKLNRNELFFITPRSVMLKFHGWKEISDKEADDYYFDAMADVVLEDVDLKEGFIIPHATYTILSFGRRKPYFDNMISGISEFARKQKDDTICLIFMGDVSLSEAEQSILKSASNITIKMIPPKRPIPRCVFDKSDVVIAASGCARISFEAGYKTISMNVENNQPLGLLGFTTTQNAYQEHPKDTNVSLDIILRDVLVEKKYNGKPKLELPRAKKGLEWQYALINNDRQYWPDINKISLDTSSVMRVLEKIILRMGGIKIIPPLFSLIRKS